MYFGYGIMRCNNSYSAAGTAVIEQGKLCLIAEGALTMLCFESDEVQAVSTEQMRRYTETLSTLIRETTIIPLRFGTVFDHESQIHEVLRQGKKTYQKLLKQMENKIEVEVKIWWKKESFVETMLKDRRLATWKKALETGKGLGYDVVDFGQAIKETADREREELRKRCLAVLKRIATDFVVKEPVDEYQAFFGVFLVDKREEEAFDRAVGEIYCHMSEDMVFKYTGPWAPHHFVGEER